MKKNLFHRLVILASLGAIAGCASPQASFNKVQNTITGRTGQRVEWLRGGPEDAEVSRAVQTLLHRDLTANSAAQIALLNNRALQANFEEIGISQADLVEAGLLSNPTFAASWRFPDRSPSGTNTEYSIAQDFLQLLVLPLRKRIAAAQLAQIETRVADEVLKLVTAVKTAFYALQAREQLLGRFKVITQTSEAAAEFTKRLHDAGNASDLDLANQQGSYQQGRFDIAQTTLQARADRERLNRLLGLWGENTDWKITDHLPEIPAHEVSLQHLESRAIAQRLDLAAARIQVDLIGRALALRTKTRYLPASVQIGVDTERDPDHQNVTGPTLDLELPIFNQGQGEIARLTAQYRQAQRQLEALAIDIRSEVRQARDQRWARSHVLHWQAASSDAAAGAQPNAPAV